MDTPVTTTTAILPDSPVLRVATDCSGIEAPIVALKKCRIPFVHVFSSEMDPFCVQTLQANFTPKILYRDLTKRNLRSVPGMDLYVCGFPCQPYSLAGHRQGQDDPRGNIFPHCLRLIQNKKPRVFVLENVRGLLSIDKGDTFRSILKSLQSLKYYHVYWKLLDTSDYGVPQSRKRIYIVGIARSALIRPFQWPRPKKCPPIETFIDQHDNHIIQPLPNHFYTSGMDRIIPPDAVFIDLGYPRHCHKESNRLCPCITTGCHTLYNLRRKRYATVRELLKLQGFPLHFRIPVSKTQFQKQIGNTMSVNVLVALFKSIFQTLKPIGDEA